MSINPIAELILNQEYFHKFLYNYKLKIKSVNPATEFLSNITSKLKKAKG